LTVYDVFSLEAGPLAYRRRRLRFNGAMLCHATAADAGLHCFSLSRCVSTPPREGSVRRQYTVVSSASRRLVSRRPPAFHPVAHCLDVTPPLGPRLSCVARSDSSGTRYYDARHYVLGAVRSGSCMPRAASNGRLDPVNRSRKCFGTSPRRHGMRGSARLSGAERLSASLAAVSLRRGRRELLDSVTAQSTARPRYMARAYAHPRSLRLAGDRPRHLSWLASIRSRDVLFCIAFL